MIVPEGDAAERVIARAPALEAKAAIAESADSADRNRGRPAGGGRGPRPRPGHRDADRDDERHDERDDERDDHRRRLPDVR